jgi:hypothetical protein
MQDYSSTKLPSRKPINLPLTSTKFALPIPQELNANPGIQQNPGY